MEITAPAEVQAALCELTGHFFCLVCQLTPQPQLVQG